MDFGEPQTKGRLYIKELKLMRALLPESGICVKVGATMRRALEESFVASERATVVTTASFNYIELVHIVNNGFPVSKRGDSP